MNLDNPYVFIVGCQRSGTTVLKRMVNAHPHIAITSESNWILRLFEKHIGLTAEGLVTPELISHLLALPEFTRWGIGRAELESLMGSGQPVSYADFVTDIFDLYGKAQGKTLVGNKTPANVRRLHALHTLWPSARVVHLIRDGRDVCLSTMNWPTARQKKPGTFPTWEQDPVSTTALWWELHVGLGRQAANWLGSELYYEIRYESLVANPAQECAALCAFLGLPYNDAMLRFFEGRTKEDPALESKERWLPVTAGLRDWNAHMGAEDVERFEAAAGKLLDELGYPRAFPHPRPERLEGSERIRNVLAQDPSWQHHSRVWPAGNEVSVQRTQRGAV